ncbi:hypothetical protein BB560_003856 [Smittium megazygosporum]|uniref:Uncharacterized protein n=1 Tax=Smittium megazygosporum TaxID=133381 RepID=A0A2T9ZAW2_9FUNG|nr:hypothetical protein BB560_003856 [Smittium megazygosporum]
MGLESFWAKEKLDTSSGINSLETPKISDFHVHLRQGEMLKAVVPMISQGGADTILVMPNLVPPLTNTEMVLAYKKEILDLDPTLNLLMTLYLSPELTPEEIRKASASGIVGVKMYPLGVTTNSQFGVADLSSYHGVFKEMEKVNMVLNLHGECPSNHETNVCVLNAEEKFLDTLKYLHNEFPKLRIVLEHATSKAAVECVKSLGDTVACTITAHHLLITIDDWAGQPHNYCKPVAKFPFDRDALRQVVVDGSDSAPHLQSKKESSSPAAGVFTSPILLPLLASVFENLGCLENLQKFTSDFGRAFYKLDQPPSTIRIQKSPTLIPNSFTVSQSQSKTDSNPSDSSIARSSSNSSNCIVPFLSGTQLPWKILE